MKKVLIISSSPRESGNSNELCKQFKKGAEESGNQVELIRLKDTKIGYCIGCGYCHKNQKCFQNDDMQSLCQKVLDCDVLVLATPVYFYTMSAQLKTFIDRLTPIYTKVRADIYLFATAWDENTKILQGTLESMRGLTRDCFEGCEEKGALAVGGVYSQKSIEGHPSLQQAYLMGKNC